MVTAAKNARRIKLNTTVTQYPAMMLALDQIKAEPDVLQVRAKLDVKWADRIGVAYRKGEPVPDLLVFKLPNGRMMLVDGFHRFYALDRLGFREVQCQVREGTLTEAIVAALEANTAEYHRGRPFEKADREHAAELLIRNGAGEVGAGSWDWSDSELARRSGCSAGFVRSTRERLALPEAIPAPVPIPEKVWPFRDGRKIGKRIPYRTAQSTGRPAISAIKRGESSTEFRSRIGGKSVYLGSEEEAAERELDRRLEGRDAVRPTLARNQSFIQWAAARGVPARPVEQRESYLGGIRVGDALALLLPAVDFDPVLREVGRAQLLRLVLPWCRRTILVGYRDDGSGRVGAALALAARLPQPIEFLEPEEFVAEFATEGDGPPAE